MKKKFFLAAFTLGTATLASTLFSTPAKAVDASADVDIQVEIPPIIFIQTYDKLTFKPTTAGLTGVKNPQEGTIDNLSPNSTVSPELESGDSSSETTQLGSAEAKNVLVYKVWGLGGDGNLINHSVKYDGKNLTQGESIIGVKATSANGGQEVAPGLDYSQAIEGTVDFEFDFAKVTQAGLHTGGKLTITATAE